MDVDAAGDQTGSVLDSPFANIEPEEPMSRVTDGPRSDLNQAGDRSSAGARGGQDALVGKVVCPFCGQQKSSSTEPCPRCTMEDTPATRQATKARIGPWYVLQNRSPSAPGMKYTTLLWLVNKGHVTPRSIVRGPTTYQLWRYAAHVRGLSREFGLCYSCGGGIEKSASVCPHCERPQDPPADTDALLEVRDGAASSSLHSPVMREIDPHQTRARAASEARRTPPPAAAKTKRPQDEDEHDDFEPAASEAEALAGSDEAEPSHLERLRTRNEVMIRQRQELARRGGRGGGSLISATNLAAALQDPDDAPARSRRFSVLNLILFVLLLLGGAAAAVLYIKPEYRAPSAQWVNETWSTVREKLSALQWNSLPGEDPTGGVAQQPAQQPLQRPAQLPAQTSPMTTQPALPEIAPPPLAAIDLQPQSQRLSPTTLPQDAQVKVVPEVDPKPPQAEPAAPQSDPRLARDTRAPAEPPAPQPQPEAHLAQPRVVTKDPPPEQRRSDSRAGRSAATERPRPPQQPQQQPPPAVSEARTVEQALDESRRLYRQAIDAEARDDHATALRHYEQIRKLPRETWPGDLQIRIDLTREQIKSRSAKSE